MLKTRGRKQPGPEKWADTRQDSGYECITSRKIEHNIHYYLGLVHLSISGIQYEA